MPKIALLVAGILNFAVAAPLRATAEPAGDAPVAGEHVVRLPYGVGLTQRVLFDAPPHPRATLIMLPGGTGEVGLRRDGAVRHDDNFVVRTRQAFVARGYAVLIPETVAKINLRGMRSSPAYGRVVDGLAEYARQRFGVPVFLVGTSQGTIAAMNGAAHAPSGLVSGVVLSESISVPGRRSTETVFDADPPGVRVPALVIANRDDRCDVAPPAMAPRIASAMAHSPSVRVLRVEGGEQRSKTACGSRSPHGYDGIERPVIAAITAWLRAHGG
ncbi:alpha/beta hydrolase [Jiella sp. MQZ9-1]|uniref:Alpha/beta hydrolase n=1 Tax=Jiella flava TaxID=2816857 RepID=A0A939FU33_9HYPH|nr:alpha/beta hydrolase [Jiella flava]MBO0661572.1 alpha/beta hydrolase [Jiella flava]MCD2470214.1 alpha/beta hydrolase [Jiella flava]